MRRAEITSRREGYPETHNSASSDHLHTKRERVVWQGSGAKAPGVAGLTGAVGGSWEQKWKGIPTGDRAKDEAGPLPSMAISGRESNKGRPGPHSFFLLPACDFSPVPSTGWTWLESSGPGSLENGLQGLAPVTDREQRRCENGSEWIS